MVINEHKPYYNNIKQFYVLNFYIFELQKIISIHFSFVVGVE